MTLLREEGIDFDEKAKLDELIALILGGGRLMVTYVDLKFYADSYNGELSESEFQNVIIKATAHVRRITFGRADSYIDGDEVKYATCAVCDVIAADEKRRKKHQGMNVTSENIDGYSVSFAQEQSAGEAAEELLNRKIYKSAEPFLMQTGLLDWGLDV